MLHSLQPGNVEIVETLIYGFFKRMNRNKTADAQVAESSYLSQLQAETNQNGMQPLNDRVYGFSLEEIIENFIQNGPPVAHSSILQSIYTMQQSVLQFVEQQLAGKNPITQNRFPRPKVNQGFEYNLNAPNQLQSLQESLPEFVNRTVNMANKYNNQHGEIEFDNQTINLTANVLSSFDHLDEALKMQDFSAMQLDIPMNSPSSTAQSSPHQTPTPRKTSFPPRFAESALNFFSSQRASMKPAKKSMEKPAAPIPAAADKDVPSSENGHKQQPISHVPVDSPATSSAAATQDSQIKASPPAPAKTQIQAPVESITKVVSTNQTNKTPEAAPVSSREQVASSAKSSSVDSVANSEPFVIKKPVDDETKHNAATIEKKKKEIDQKAAVAKEKEKKDIVKNSLKRPLDTSDSEDSLVSKKPTTLRKEQPKSAKAPLHLDDLFGDDDSPPHKKHDNEKTLRKSSQKEKSLDGKLSKIKPQKPKDDVGYKDHRLKRAEKVLEQTEAAKPKALDQSTDVRNHDQEMRRILAEKAEQDKRLKEVAEKKRRDEEEEQSRRRAAAMQAKEEKEKSQARPSPVIIPPRKTEEKKTVQSTKKPVVRPVAASDGPNPFDIAMEAMNKSHREDEERKAAFRDPSPPKNRQLPKPDPTAAKSAGSSPLPKRAHIETSKELEYVPTPIAKLKHGNVNERLSSGVPTNSPNRMPIMSLPREKLDIALETYSKLREQHWRAEAGTSTPTASPQINDVEQAVAAIPIGEDPRKALYHVEAPPVADGYGYVATIVESKPDQSANDSSFGYYAQQETGGYVAVTAPSSPPRDPRTITPVTTVPGTAYTASSDSNSEIDFRSLRTSKHIDFSSVGDILKKLRPNNV